MMWTPTDILPHQGRMIPVRTWHEDGRLVVEALLHKGEEPFKPGAHEMTVTIEIMSGSGIFERQGMQLRYITGSIFGMPKGITHGFIQVDEDTIFRKKVLFPLT